MFDSIKNSFIGPAMDRLRTDTWAFGWSIDLVIVYITKP